MFWTLSFRYGHTSWTLSFRHDRILWTLFYQVTRVQLSTLLTGLSTYQHEYQHLLICLLIISHTALASTVPAASRRVALASTVPAASRRVALASVPHQPIHVDASALRSETSFYAFDLRSNALSVCQRHAARRCGYGTGQRHAARTLRVRYWPAPTNSRAKRDSRRPRDAAGTVLDTCLMLC